MRQALGETKPIRTADLWDQIAADMSQKPYKSIGMDLLAHVRDRYDFETKRFLKIKQVAETAQRNGRDLNTDYHDRRYRQELEAALSRQSAPLTAALARNGEVVDQMADGVLDAVGQLVAGYDDAKARIAAAAKRANKVAEESQLQTQRESSAPKMGY
jgi:hypothetical protein